MLLLRVPISYHSAAASCTIVKGKGKITFEKRSQISFSTDSWGARVLSGQNENAVGLWL